jgi:hypothetical protein
MQSTAALVHDDPYMRLTPRQRVAEVKRRRQNFFGKNRPTINPAPRAVDQPLEAIDPAVRRWIETKKETFSQPWYHVMWFFDLVIVRDPPTELPRRKYPRIQDIQRAVADFYDVKVHDINAQRRTANIVRPRQVGYYLCKMKTLKSLPEIGRNFGGRDHTSILSGIRKIERLLMVDEDLNADIDHLSAQIDEFMRAA